MFSANNSSESFDKFCKQFLHYALSPIIRWEVIE
ncbi:hypothetical protein BAMY6614_12655 [Bacillus amyloliquefaciens UMAF6614]|nr:hypothetical protein BAMY6614_12655 [Bacillus amyloliquefaciens UMAF6614]